MLTLLYKNYILSDRTSGQNISVTANAWIKIKIYTWWNLQLKFYILREQNFNFNVKNFDMKKFPNFLDTL